MATLHLSCIGAVLILVMSQVVKSKFINEEQLLKAMPHADLLEVQALLHKRLGDHKAALR